MESFNDIISGEGLTLVDFFATWCGPCKMMHPILEQLKEKMGDSIRIMRLAREKRPTKKQFWPVSFFSVERSAAAPSA